VPRQPLIQVLVIDDSAVVRQLLGSLLGSEPGFRVDVASDPLIAMEKMRRARPDVILLDLDLPRMDGLTFLRKLMREDPIPVVVCAALAGPRTDAGMQALEEGALEIVAKPTLGLRDFLHESRDQLVDSLRAAALARLRPPARPAPDRARAQAQAAARTRVAPRRPAPSPGGFQLLALGASTGGTEALRDLLQVLPPELPPLLVVQHMPPYYTRAFAERLDALSRLEVKEAAEGDEARPGRVLVAPGDRHLVVHRRGGRYVVSLDDGPLVSRHRPSVDVLFRSVAESAGPGAVGVLLTGMGSDGAAGLLELRRRGGATLVQDEASSVVFGMPKEAIALGAAERVVALESLPAAILECVAARAGRTS
jgi:two-component system chemotaxis response regulator CheB